MMIYYDTKNSSATKNWCFIIGILILCIGLQFANYGTAVCISGELAKMDAMEFYTLVAAMSGMGMILILPVVGKLTAIWGQRNMILAGILIQLSGRICMMFCTSWIPYMLALFLQAVGGGFYISSPYATMAVAVQTQERTRFFGYIAVANAAGAILGPVIASSLYAAGGILAKLSYVVNFPLTLLGFLLIFRSCPNKKVPGAAKGFDYPGLILTVVGLACLVLWLNLCGKMFGWISIPSAVLFIAAAISIGIMVHRELTIPNPAVPLRMFRNKRLTYAFICAMVVAAYGSCAASYSVVWIRQNYSHFPAGSIFTGTATLTQQLVILVLGFFLGGYIGKQFTDRFRKFGVLSMIAVMTATGLLYCLRFTGTAAQNNILSIGNAVPVGMLVIYIATAIGGMASVISQSTYTTFWQSNTPAEEIPAGQALYSFGSTGGAVVFGAVAGVVLGTSGDYSRVFATGFVFACIGLICAWIGFRFSEKG